MKVPNPASDIGDHETSSVATEDDLLPLIRGRSSRSSLAEGVQGVLVGQLIGMRDDAQTPLVVYPGQEGAAVAARSTIDLHRAHIGKDVALMFEGGDASKPIIIGVLRGPKDRHAMADQLDLSADGERLIVNAKDQIVLRCGRASIILTKQGKVIIQGAYVSSQSSGVLRIKGGSVQIN